MARVALLLAGICATAVRAAQAQAQPQACAGAAAHWKSAAEIGTIEILKDHLARFQNCAFAALAAQKIKDAEAAAARAAPAPRVDPCASAATHWASAASIGTIEAYKDHLDRFSNCPSAALAAQQIKAAEVKAAEAAKAEAAKAEAAKAEAAKAEAARVAAAKAEAAKAEAAKVEAARVAAAKAEAAKAEAAKAAAAAEAARAETAKLEAAKLEAAKADAMKAAPPPPAANAGPPAAVASAPAAAASAPPVASIDASDLARLLQIHLKRVGCDPGSPNGEWNAASIHALEAFNKSAGTSFDVKVASLDALNNVRTRSARICPLVCPPGQRAAADQCVHVTCGHGFHLDSDGACQKDKPARPPARAAHASPGHAPAAGGGKCFTFNGKRFCE